MTVMSQGHGANDQRAQLEALYAAMAPKGDMV